MRIPKRLTIGGQLVKVKYDDIEPAGLADFENSTIILRKGMKRRITEETFFHECMHFTNTTVSHSLLDSISHSMYALLKNNKLI